MEVRDVFKLTIGTIRAHKLRTLLTMLGIAIGTASVILLTSIVEGTRVFILNQFTQFGTNLLSVVPGKSVVFGLPGAVSTTRKLTLEDARALLRIHGVLKVVPICFGSAKVEAGNRARSVFIRGVTSDAPEVWQFRVRQGQFLPASDWNRGEPLTALGPTLKKELFGSENALGQHVRIGERRFQVIGVMESKGQMLGIDIDDAAYIHVAMAMKLFNKDGMQEIHILFSNAQIASSVEKEVRRVMKERHDNEEDFTITTQTEMLARLDSILSIIGMGLGAIAAISLIVGSVGILTMMWISVNERVSEIGLEKAIGAEPRQILLLFLSEAALLSTIGGTLGVITGLAVGQLLGLLIPALPVKVPTPYVILSLLVSVVVGLASGVLPARRAAQLDPLEALRAE